MEEVKRRRSREAGGVIKSQKVAMNRIKNDETGEVKDRELRKEEEKGVEEKEKTEEEREKKLKEKKKEGKNKKGK